MIGVSLIIPCYKRIEQTLKTTKLVLDSDGIGTEFYFELIIADCTPDDSLERAVRKTFGDRVIYKRTEKRGLATNKNQGARIAKYELIIFCDSDIEVEKDTVLKTLQALQKNPTAGGVGGTTIWKGGENDGKIDRPDKDDRRQVVDGVTYSEILYGRYFGTYKSIWDAAGQYDEVVFNLLGESSDMSTRIWRAGFPLIYDKSIEMYHCHDAPESLATRADHKEYIVVRNWLLLMYKFNMFDSKQTHFTQHINRYLSALGEDHAIAIFNGFGKFFDEISDAIAYFKTQKQITPQYNFTFLEVFSDEKLFNECLAKAKDRLAPIRKRAGF
jgi:GT2 family glycosyltransferase